MSYLKIWLCDNEGSEQRSADDEDEDELDDEGVGGRRERDLDRKGYGLYTTRRERQLPPIDIYLRPIAVVHSSSEHQYVYSPSKLACYVEILQMRGATECGRTANASIVHSFSGDSADTPLRIRAGCPSNNICERSGLSCAIRDAGNAALWCTIAVTVASLHPPQRDQD